MELEKAVEQLKLSGKKPSLIICIDELDRCRPTFAIEMLERIKHLFDVPGIIFLLSIDKSQLESSTAAVYGERINAPEYLRRFIDLEYALPTIQGKAFTEVLIKRFKLDEVFAKRNHREFQYDMQHFVEFFTLVADGTQLSLRTRERCMTRLQVVMDQTPETHFLFPPLVALLIVLRTTNPKLFTQLKSSSATASDVMTYLSELPEGNLVVKSRQGAIMEIGLLLGDENRERREQSLEQLRELAAKEGASQIRGGRASELVEAIRSFQNIHSGGPRLGYLLDKIDLSSGLGN